MPSSKRKAMNSNGQPTTIVIFGASGDLTWRKLVPGLFNLFRRGSLPGEFNIVGFAWTEMTSDAFRQQMQSGAEEFSSGTFDAEVWQNFAGHLHYVTGGFSDEADYARLEAVLGTLEDGPANRLYYLATAPRFFGQIVTMLGGAGMAQEHETVSAVWRRVVIEKPFGRDLDSARALNQEIHTVLAEHQIYRIDHYLAKETVQNILVFRFANTMFEPIWNRNYIDHVQITVAEAVDVGHRAGYYDQAGVLRDMFQNHLMQLLALVSMEPPASFEADAVRDEKVKALKSVRPVAPADMAVRTVRAQYKGYCATDGLAAGSQTPTYAALKLYIDNWRWRGVPFYLRSGKAMAHKTSEIIVQFKEPPHLMFPIPQMEAIKSNYLALCIQPHEGFHQRVEVKMPGRQVVMRSVDMDFHYDEVFQADVVPEAYETLLLNALEGDATLFTRSDGIEAAWRIIDPVLQAWEHDAEPPLATYGPGSWGPLEADELLARSGHDWRHGCIDES
jgi:glucose-6-phosphate 1-dehydrogenase